jgi:hypothetical protein
MRFRLVTIPLILFLIPVFLYAGIPAGPNSHHTASSKKSKAKKGPSTRIMGRGKVAPETMTAFLIKNNSDADKNTVNRLVKIYVIEANREGVNYEIAFCQMCLETGFLRFEGSVSRFQNNFCGLGCVDAWSGGDWFASAEEGVRAHIQHLKAYASTEPLRGPLVDPRFVHVQRGTASDVFQLTGRWATDPAYGQKIFELLKRLYGL